MTRLLATLGFLLSTLAAQASERIHGADHHFVGPSIRIIWAIAWAPDPEMAGVVLRVVNADRTYSHVALDGVDPFTKARKNLLPTRPLGAKETLSVSRGSFTDWPSREIKLYKTAAEIAADRPALVVYYLSVPDTTPEFNSPSGVEAFLDHAEVNPPRR